eukprot:gene32793-43835_t
MPMIFNSPIFESRPSVGFLIDLILGPAVEPLMQPAPVRRLSCSNEVFILRENSASSSSASTSSVILLGTVFADLSKSIEKEEKFKATYSSTIQLMLGYFRNTSESLTAYFAPIGQFLTNPFEDIAIWPDEFKRILQYDRNNSVILVKSGLYRGSCGCLYVSQSGEVVALHTESMHEGRNISAVKSTKKKNKKKRSIAEMTAEVDEVMSSATTDVSDVLSSIRQGFVLTNIVPLLTMVDTENAL